MNNHSGMVSDLFLVCFQCLGELVRAGGLLGAAGDAFHAGDHIVNIHTLDKGANALQISVAAANKYNIFQLVVFDIKANGPGAGTSGVILIHKQFLSNDINVFLKYTFKLYDSSLYFARENFGCKPGYTIRNQTILEDYDEHGQKCGNEKAGTGADH